MTYGTDRFNYFGDEEVIVNELDFILRFQRVYLKLKKDYPSCTFHRATLVEEKSGKRFLMVSIGEKNTPYAIGWILTFYRLSDDEDYDYDKT